MTTELTIAATGFVSPDAGSMAGANGLLLKALLARSCRIDFFSKSTFVDPRPVIGNHGHFLFHETINAFEDGLRRKVQSVPGLSALTQRWDSSSYNRAILASIDRAHHEKPFDVCLWLGDYARGRISGLPNISFAQGPPGTDARSILRRFAEIKRLSGRLNAWKWWGMARLRLSPLGLPPFGFSDHIIVGSSQSKSTLINQFGIPESRVSTLQYPVDLQVFEPRNGASTPGVLRCLWLGRIIPRKRLDLFLDAAEMAVARGIDVRLTVAGDIRLVPGYEKLIEDFPYPERVTWRKAVPRDEVPELIRQHDVLIQPSEEEDFGSSVAEAQACGIPVIVGPTNGNRDYLSARDFVLREASVDALCDAMDAVFTRREEPNAAAISRETAEKFFGIDRVAEGILEILKAQKMPSRLNQRFTTALSAKNRS